MHRKELSAVFGRSYVYVHGLREDKLYRLPALVREEFAAAACLIGLAACNIRWELSTRISATDATDRRGGGAETSTTPAIAYALFKVACHRGEHVRLDWASKSSAPPPSDMPSIQNEFHEIVTAHKWKATRSYDFSQHSHVNLQELRAVKSEIKAIATSHQGPMRHVNL